MGIAQEGLNVCEPFNLFISLPLLQSGGGESEIDGFNGSQPFKPNSQCVGLPIICEAEMVGSGWFYKSTVYLWGRCFP